MDAFSEDVTLGLLENPLAWRMRAIERIVLSHALWSKRERDIHVKALDEVAAGGGVPELKEELDCLRSRGVKRAEVTLPITELPKVPLLDLHITVAENPVYRVPLDESARLQALYLEQLAKDAGLKKHFENGDLRGLLAAIFYFPSAKYDEQWRKYSQLNWHPRTWSNWNRRKKGKVDPLYEYLESNLPGCNDEVKVEPCIYKGWDSARSGIETVVQKRAMDNYLSGAENPLIALPHYAQEVERRKENGLDETGWSTKRATSTLNQLKSLLDDAVDLAKNEKTRETRKGETARRLLDEYAAYGYRWMAFAKCIIPLDEPFTIAVKEQRSVYFSVKWRKEWKTRTISIGEHLGKTVWKQVAYADAETNHVSIRLADTAVRLHPNCETLDETGEPVETDLDEESRTFELYLRHDSTENRPRRIWIKCHVRLARLTSAFLYLAMAVTAGATALLYWRGLHDHRSGGKDYVHGITAKDAAVILLPVAFVTAFLLVKESSTLIMRIRKVRQSILVAELFVLLATALSLYFWRLIWASP